MVSEFRIFLFMLAAVCCIMLQNGIMQGAALYAHSAQASPWAAIRCNRCQ
jgi:hypothetical protein